MARTTAWVAALGVLCGGVFLSAPSFAQKRSVAVPTTRRAYRRPPAPKPKAPAPKPRASRNSGAVLRPIPGIRASRGSVGNGSGALFRSNGRMLVNGRLVDGRFLNQPATTSRNNRGKKRRGRDRLKAPLPPAPPPPTPTDLIAAPWRPTADEFGPRASQLGNLALGSFDLSAGRRGAVPLWLSGTGPRVWEDTGTTAYGDPYTVHFAVVSVPMAPESTPSTEEIPKEDGFVHGPPARLSEKAPLEQAFLRAREALSETIGPKQVTLLDFYIDDEASTVHVIAGGKSIAQVVAP